MICMPSTQRNSFRIAFFEPTSVPRSISILPALSSVLQLEQYQSTPVTFASPNCLELSHIFKTMPSSEDTLIGSPFWWSVMDDLALGETYRSDLANVARSIQKSEGLDLLEEGIPQMAVSLIPFFQHLFVKLGKHGECSKLSITHINYSKLRCLGCHEIRTGHDAWFPLDERTKFDGKTSGSG